MMIDRDAVRSLELVANARGVDQKKCLFGVMNHTNTLAGARLLRTNILSVRMIRLPLLLYLIPIVATLLSSYYQGSSRVRRGASL